jgi:hypothetical protein
MVPAGWLASLRCLDCGSDQVVTIDPGQEAEKGKGGVLIRRGRDVRGWCLDCARRRGWLILPSRANAGARAVQRDNPWRSCND